MFWKASKINWARSVDNLYMGSVKVSDSPDNFIHYRSLFQHTHIHTNIYIYNLVRLCKVTVYIVSNDTGYER
jgi:hypothetical protein